MKFGTHLKGPTHSYQAPTNIIQHKKLCLFVNRKETLNSTLFQCNQIFLSYQQDKLPEMNFKQETENNLLNCEDTHVKLMFNRMCVKPDLLYWLCQSFKNCWAPEYELATIKIIVVFSVFENTLEVLGAEQHFLTYNIALVITEQGNIYMTKLRYNFLGVVH